MTANSKIVLASRPQGEAVAANFRMVAETLRDPAEGEVLVRHHYLSLDPYMRGRMNDAKSYAACQQIDDVMIGGTVGVVLASHIPRLKAGDHVVGMGGWQTHSLSNGAGLQKVDASKIPLQAYLGPVGMPGVTAWYGINRIIKPKKGETIVVSAATGAVGTVVGQLAKLAGARAVGIAGGAEKCAYAVSELGFDACVDHRAADFKKAFFAATDKGVDGVFENVGGLPLDLAMRKLNDFARIAVCGLVASGYDGTPSPLQNVAAMLSTRSLMQGFIVSDDMSVWPQALGELGAMVASGKLKWRETVAQGLEAAPEAFFGMLKGKNFGKQLVKLA